MAIPITETLPNLKWRVSGKTYSYQITQDDLIWLARAANHEGKPRVGVIWTMIQRFALRYPKYQKKLSTAVRAFSQPVNPIWFPDAGTERRGHLSELRRIREKDVSAAERTKLRRQSYARAKKRRDVHSRETWSQIKPEVRQVVQGVLHGTIPSPNPRAIDFRASMAPRGVTPVQARQRAERYAEGRPSLQLTEIPGVTFQRGRNWFFTSTAARSLKLTPFGRPPDPKASPRSGCCCCCPSRQCSHGVNNG